MSRSAAAGAGAARETATKRKTTRAARRNFISCDERRLFVLFVCWGCGGWREEGHEKDELGSVDDWLP
jgi:hypothetical protein